MPDDVPVSPTVSANLQTHDTSVKHDYVGGLSWASFALSIILLALGRRQNSSANESDWLVLLFALPLLGQGIGQIVLFHRPRVGQKTETFHWFYVITMTLCVGTNYLFWVGYSSWKNELTTPGLSYLALINIAVLISLVIVMTLAIMCGPVQEKKNATGIVWRLVLGLIRWCVGILNNLRTGTSQEPFLAVLLFFTVFLGVSYLFGFAFAFHDKSMPKPEPGHALYMRTSYISKPLANPSPSPFTTYKIYFGSLEAIPDIEATDPDLQLDAKLKTVAERKKRNSQNLDALVNDIVKINADDALRITIVGHADDAPTLADSRTSNTRYLSNYELSEARAQHVRQKIIERLVAHESNRWRNIDWLCVAASNEVQGEQLTALVKRASNTKQNGTKVLPEEKRFAEVRIEQPWNEAKSVEIASLDNERPKDMQLIDYIYFANYTITTTGYGDIIPLTPYSKFICSLANICEVFFLVVFFNSLLSLRRIGG